MSKNKIYSTTHLCFILLLTFSRDILTITSNISPANTTIDSDNFISSLLKLNLEKLFLDSQVICTTWQRSYGIGNVRHIQSGRNELNSVQKLLWDG